MTTVRAQLAMDEEEPQPQQPAAAPMIQMQQHRLNLEATREIRRRLEHAKWIGVTDGTNRESLREWLRGVDNARTWVNAYDNLIMEMVGYLISGSLATMVGNYITESSPEEHTWIGVKNAIIKAFLDEDEQEYLHSKVDNVLQSLYEDYRTHVTRAYEAEESAVPLVQTVHPGGYEIKGSILKSTFSDLQQ